ncbi:hypothetical protein RKE29_06730 [Streptomyces sp. B1866]|uniref:hypothetical protein n=1 Tax=Streptomyces sp. B1866 TaxID=3075431 RepID=UPI002892032E|nr:hypothetical protein [Streptomyces sp. B1866]MDT3396337.1 hypothetical protein [Streptomyces sp. B1866]
MAARNPYRLVTNLKYWLLSSVAFLAGLGLLYASGTGWFKDHESLGTLANQLGGLLIVSVALATLWDLVGRRSFFYEMLSALRLKHDIHVSGLESVDMDYNKVINWDEHLSSARHLDIFAAWATTWRNNYQTRLQQLASRNDAKIRVCLPDPSHSECVKMLATRFNMGQDDVRSRLNETIEYYKRLDTNIQSGRIEIYVSAAVRVFSAYRIDNRFVVTLYHHKGSRSGSVPALTCREGGTYFEFFKDDLEGVLSASTRIYP